MTIELNIERKLRQLNSQEYKVMPYEAMIHQLQDELTRTKDKDERLRLETIIVCLLGIYQLTRAVDRIARAVDKLASDG